MQIHVINQSEIQELLPMRECIDVMAEALAALARGDAILPLRPVMWLPEKVGALAMMPSYLKNLNVMGVKVISVFAGNRGTEYDSHQGAVLLFETANGRLLAIVDATAITAIRTAAVSALATKLLARQDAHDLAILGTGTQGHAHLEAMLLVRKFRRVRVWSRTGENVRRFAESESQRYGMEIEPMPSAQQAVDGADVICTTTSAEAPVLLGEWLSPGAHINAAGSSVPFTRELDTVAVVNSSFFVDRRESTLNEAGDFLFPKKEGAIGEDHIRGELGEILIGKTPGRASDQEITVFKSLGLAIEDLAAADYIYRKALATSQGAAIELGGGRHAGSL